MTMKTQISATKSALKLSSALKRLGADQRGNTMLMFAGAISIITMTGGAAIDISRRALAKEELAAAVDSGALAACRAWKVSSNNTQAETVKTEQERTARKFIEANFDQTRYDTALPTITVTYPETTGTSSAAGQFRDQIKVLVTATGTVPTTLMKVIGINELKISTKSECSRAQGGVELTMVLDNTGSMASSLNGTVKMTALRNATNKMIELLYGNQETSNLVRVNIVPYSIAVNVGRQLLDFDDPSTNDDNVNIDFTGAPSGYASKTTLSPWNPASPSSTSINDNQWYGCVIERETNDSIGLNSDGSKKALDKNADTPADAFDIRDYAANTIDTNIGINSGKWKPYIQKYNTGNTRGNHAGYVQNGSGAFVAGTVQGSDNSANNSGRGGCPAPVVTYQDGLTKSQLKSLISSTNYMKANDNTYTDIGMSWAVKLMSPAQPLASQVQYADRYSTDTANPFMGWVKGIVVMTDGVITVTPPIDAGDDLNYPITGYGFRQTNTSGNKIKGYNQTLPSSYSNYSNLTNAANTIADRLINAHEQRLLMACKQARKPVGWDVASNPYRDNDAVRVYSVFFGTSNELSSKGQIYKDCAGKDGFFINAQSEAELNNAFSNIAADLQNLRLSL